MAKKKINGDDSTPEEKELKHWEDHLERLGVDDSEPHLYSEKMQVLRDQAKQSREKNTEADSESL